MPEIHVTLRPKWTPSKVERWTFQSCQMDFQTLVRGSRGWEVPPIRRCLADLSLAAFFESSHCCPRGHAAAFLAALSLRRLPRSSFRGVLQLCGRSSLGGDPAALITIQVPERCCTPHEKVCEGVVLGDQRHVAAELSSAARGRRDAGPGKLGGYRGRVWFRG